MTSTLSPSILTRPQSGGVAERLSEVVEQGARDLLGRGVGLGGRWRKRRLRPEPTAHEAVNDAVTQATQAFFQTLHLPRVTLERKEAQQ